MSGKQLHVFRLQSVVSQRGHSQLLSISSLVGDLGHIAFIAFCGTGIQTSSPMLANIFFVITVQLARDKNGIN